MALYELAEIVTKDNLVHQGIVSPPKKPGNKALLWVHGLTGRFYGDVKLIDGLADSLNRAGIGFAAFNNRGHDIIANIHKRTDSKGGCDHVMIGAAYEVFEESVYDIEAGIAFLSGKGFSEIVIAGHSTGANKVCYYAAESGDDPRVGGVILAGPMSDRLSEKTDKKGYEEHLGIIKDLLAKGRGDALLTMAHRFPVSARRAWSLLAPNTPEDVFNYGDTEHVLEAFSTITKPLLVTLAGGDETADRPIDEIQKVFDTHTGSKRYKSVIIPETTHGYEGKEREFVNVVIDWMDAVYRT
ncbi:alpha/beta fold hydrolase [Patescibacteria group bacterium]|nr:alpha/beta fold hydrolase [Patescibacteria group bacterium]